MKRFVKLLDQVYNAFGLTYSAKFAHPAAAAHRRRRAVGSRRGRAEGRRSKALGIAYELKPGDGAFYGPKIDFDVTD